MNRKWKSIFRNTKHSARRGVERTIIRPLAQIMGISLLDCAHRQVGIGGSHRKANGEEYLLARVLPHLLAGKVPIIFDIGANTGDYSLAVLQYLMAAKIYAFEPVPGNFASLSAKVPGARVQCIPMGLGEQQGDMNIYDYAEGTGSQHASLFPKVFSDFHKASAIRETEVHITTMDDFCERRGITNIDFLKIDTEGNELAVLRGGGRMITGGNVPIIQFEFNEMNVASRCFLKDFYDTLVGYDFYRLAEYGLVRLKEYHPRNEIFQFQNILAVRVSDYPYARIRKFSHWVR